MLSDTLKAVREVLLLADKVDRLGQTLEKVAIEVNDQDKRIVRLEAFVEMAMINQNRIDAK
ncbi:MAG: hypothetical protein DRR06_18195 [Gammaproteobacteria bacterium]|nr:MAG: hypothetical protein DRR06_18195 [Gammaproteobacteria bacterium]